ncbi:MAG: response regulator [Acidobacteria bacterium]|nr:response regulator [Acidobacteriota bacterium]
MAMPPERQIRVLNILESEHYDVTLAADAGRAMMLLGFPAHFDLVLVDADIPGGSWREILQMVIASRPECEVIVCSRCGEEDLWADVIQSGAFDLIPDPIERNELLRIVNSARNSEYLRRFTHFHNAQAS